MSEFGMATEKQVECFIFMADDVAPYTLNFRMILLMWKYLSVQNKTIKDNNLIYLA